MKLYWYKDFRDRSESEKLLRFALKDYMCRSGIFKKCGNEDEEIDKINVLREKGGKPYIDVPNVFFNISHCQNLWICGLAGSPLGVDIEIVRERKYERLVDRYFNPEEALYVKKNGLVGFFEIWTFKEAHSKLFGESIFKNLRFSAVENGKIRKCTPMDSNTKANSKAKSDSNTKANSKAENDSNTKAYCRYKVWNPFVDIGEYEKLDVRCAVAMIVGDKSKNISEHKSENKCEGVFGDKREDMSEGMFGDMCEDMFEEISEDIQVELGEIKL